MDAQLSSPINQSPQQPGFWIRIFGAGLVLGIASGLVCGLGLGIILSPSRTVAADAAQQVIQAAPAQAVAQPTPLPDVDVAETTVGIAAYRTVGKVDAPVKLVLFEDPQCPYCQKMSAGPVKQIIEQYVKTGKASLSYRHALFLGPESFAIAAAMDCAGEQGKFWEFQDQAYGNQKPENGGLVDAALLTSWAKSAGVASVDTFTACMGKGNTASAPSALIKTDLSASKALHVLGTPTLFINGKRLIGYTPLEFITAAIDEQWNAVSAMAK